MKTWMIVLIIIAAIVLLIIIISAALAAKRRREEDEFVRNVYEGSFKIGFALGEKLADWSERSRNRRR